MNLSDYVPEIRCPKCFSYILINQVKENTNLSLFCENCGKIELSFYEFNSFLEQNSKKICLNCFKNFFIKEMLYDQKSKIFLCQKCFMSMVNKNEIKENNFILINEKDKNCAKHNTFPRAFFCKNCKKHFCSECEKEHFSHCVINILEEAKKKNNIEELKLLLKKEEKELEEEEKFGELILNHMTLIFQNNYKNRNDIQNLKKYFYLYLKQNSDNYYSYQNANFLISQTNNPDFFINDSEIKNLDLFLKMIKINDNNIKSDNISKKENNINTNIIQKNIITKIKNHNSNSDNIKNSFGSMPAMRKKSESEIKLKTISPQNTKISSYNALKMPNIYLNNNEGNFNNNLKKPKFLVISPVKQHQKKIKFNLYYGKKNNLYQEINNDKNILSSEKFKGKIISMILLTKNKILICISSELENLLLIDIIKNKHNIISLKILDSAKIGDKPIIHLENCQNGNIFACSIKGIYIIRIIDNKIKAIDFPPNKSQYNLFMNNEIISCLFFKERNFLFFCNNNKNESITNIICYANSNKLKPETKHYKLLKLEKFKIFSVEKISNNIFVLIGEKENAKLNIYLKFFKFYENKFTYINEMVLHLKEKNNKEVIIKQLVDNYIVIYLQFKGFFIYNFESNYRSYPPFNYQMNKIIALDIIKINNQIFLYTIEITESSEKIRNFDHTLINKYLIKIINKSKEYIFEIKKINSNELPIYLNDNIINNMIVICDDEKEEKEKNGSDNNLVLFTDDKGYIYYQYF